MTCHTTKSRAYGSTPSTDIITYRYNKKLVYVPVAPDHTQAIQHARDAFPQLSRLRDGTISLSLSTPGGRDGREHTLVSISAPAWPKLITHLSRYQIIDVYVEQRGSGSVGPIPEITITYADEGAEDKGPVPPYQRREGEDDKDDINDEKMASRSRTTSTTSSMLHPSKRGWLFQKLHGQ